MARILIDFDGTCVPRVPLGFSDHNIGSAKVLKALANNGHELILWTCRNNSKTNPYNFDIFGNRRKETSLQEAVRWFKENDIPLTGINRVPKESLEIGNSRKPIAEFIIDDTALGCPTHEISVSYKIRETGEIIENFKTRCVDWKKLRSILKKEGLL